MLMRINAIDSTGLLQNISTIVAGQKINIAEIHATTEKTSSGAVITLTLDVQTCEQFVSVLHLIDQLNNVLGVQRVLPGQAF